MVDLTEATSIKPLKKSAAYVPLRCKSNGKFTLFDQTDDGSKDVVDPHKVKCKGGRKGGQLRPTLKMHKDQEKLSHRTRKRIREAKKKARPGKLNIKLKASPEFIRSIQKALMESRS